MSDLIKRLRDEPSLHEQSNGLTPPAMMVWHNTALDAADELEHVQQIVDAAEQYVEMHEASVCCPITPRLRASNLKTLMDAVSEYKELKL